LDVIARLLIAAGADVNCDVVGGWTPLIHAIDIESGAAWQSHHETGHESTELTTLLAAGAVPTDAAFESELEQARQTEPEAETYQ
jgi:hypothetical protein